MNSDRRSYRKIYRRIWTHDGFLGLTDKEKLVALYILSGPQTNRIGLFRLSCAQLAEDLSVRGKTVTVVLLVCEAMGWHYEPKPSVVWVPSWWSFNPTGEKETNFRGMLTDLNDVPRCALMTSFFTNTRDIPERLHPYISAWAERVSQHELRTRTVKAQVELHVRTTETETDTETGTPEPRARSPLPPPAPLVRKRRLDAAWEGPRVYVPQRTHADFVGLRNHGGAEAELLAWYGQVSDEWTTGTHAQSPIEPDMIRFWKARYAEQWPAAAPTTTSREPQWVRDARRAAGDAGR